MMTLWVRVVERLAQSHTAKEMAEPGLEPGSMGLLSPFLSNTGWGGNSVTGIQTWSPGMDKAG